MGIRNPFTYKRLSTCLPTYLYINTTSSTIFIYKGFGGHSFSFKKVLALKYPKFDRYVGSFMFKPKPHGGFKRPTLVSTTALLLDRTGHLF